MLSSDGKTFYVYSEAELAQALAVYEQQLAVYERAYDEYLAKVAEISELVTDSIIDRIDPETGQRHVHTVSVRVPEEVKKRMIAALPIPEPPPVPKLWPFAAQRTD